MKTAVIPQIRVEPELRAELEVVLKQGETLTVVVSRKLTIYEGEYRLKIDQGV